MRILAICMDSAPYGSRSHEILVCEEIARAGHEVFLAAEREPKWTPESSRPPGLSFIGAKPVNDPRHAESLAYEMPSDVDVAFASSVSGAPLLAEWKKLTGKPTVVTVLDVPMFRLKLGNEWPWLRQWEPWFKAMGQASRIVVNMQRTRDSLIELKDTYKTSSLPLIDVLYYGIDTDLLDAAKPSQDPAFKQPVSHCVSAARLVPYKGWDIGLMSLGLLERKPLYHIIGSDPDEGRGMPMEMLRLVHLADYANVPTVFWGGVPDPTKAEIMKASNFGLSWSINHDVPSQAPVEIVYAGRKCLVPDLPINRDRLGPLKSLIWLSPWDTRAIADAVGDLQNNPDDQIAHPDDRKWIQENRSFRSHALSVLKTLEAVTR